MTPQDMAGNDVVWQLKVVDEMLSYYKDKFSPRVNNSFSKRHHQECAIQINEKFHTTFTQRQVYHKFHKLKAEWKIILEAKNLSGANFDDVNKIILYGETEVVWMKNVSTTSYLCQTYFIYYDANPLVNQHFPLFFNCPEQGQKGNIYKRAIAFYDEMEFIFRDKHATGEFKVLQAPNAS
jgi:hypothetical protein